MVRRSSGYHTLHLPFPYLSVGDDSPLRAVDEFLEKRNPPRDGDENHDDKACNDKAHEFALHFRYLL